MKKIILFLILFSPLAFGTNEGERSEFVEKMQALKADLLERGDKSVSEEVMKNATVVFLEEFRRFYIFTKEDHYAYPSFLIKQVLYQDKKAFLQTKGKTATSDEMYIRWVDESVEFDKIFVNN